MEYAKQGIRVNAVAPGVVETPMHKDDPKDFLKTLQPMGQISNVKDIVDAIDDRGGAARRRRCARWQMVTRERSRLPVDRTGALFITVDPERDTPATLKDYLSNFDPHLRGLTGEPAAIDTALKAYRVYAKKIPLKDGDYTMDHTAAVYLMDKDGHFVALFDLQQTPEAAADQLRGYL
jgi:SCO1/SenC/Enoyl-(Acyl carrier protein) reductase